MRPHHPAAAILVAAFIVAACANSTSNPGTLPTSAVPPSPPAIASGTPVPTPATPTATPTARPSPTSIPTPAPVDASAAFNRTLSNPLFESRITVTGVTSASGYDMPVAGTIEIRPGAIHSMVTITTPAGDQTTETITIGGHAYEMRYGVWFDLGAPRAGGDLAGSISDLGGFRDSGVETKDGASLHHMELPVGTSLPASALGLTDPTISNVTCRVEAWAREDGTPVLITLDMSWDQAVRGKTVHANQVLDLAYKLVDVTVEAPTALWTWRTSKAHGYEVAYPADWDVKAGSGKRADGYQGYDGTWLEVYRTRSRGYTLNAFASEIARKPGGYSGLKGARLDKNTGVTLDGVKARRVAYHGSYRGDKVWGITIVAVKGKYVYAIDYYLYHQPSNAELAVLDTFLATFSFR